METDVGNIGVRWLWDRRNLTLTPEYVENGCEAGVMIFPFVLE